MNSEAGLGFRVHSGWAALVALAGPSVTPSLLERTRISLADPQARGAVQPYHAAAQIDLKEAEIFLERITAETITFAHLDIHKALGRLEKHGFIVSACTILFASGRPPGTLAQTLASHAMIHTAEGEFFRQAIVRASEDLGLAVIRVKERDIWDQAVQRVRLPARQLQNHIEAMGKTAGPPWRQDEKLAATAAWIALSEAV